MENNSKPVEKSKTEEPSSSIICKYFGNALIKSLKENHIVNSQKIYYLNMILGCNKTY